MSARAVVVGGGPAGLMAAERLSKAGCSVTIYERMPSLGRKLLMAGRGGLNLTHAEPLAAFLGRYGTAEPWLRPLIEAFPPASSATVMFCVVTVGGVVSITITVCVCMLMLPFPSS